MKIHTMGDGLFEDAVEAVEGKPCLLLVADSREELSAALEGIGIHDDVTVIRRPAPHVMTVSRPSPVSVGKCPPDVGVLRDSPQGRALIESIQSKRDEVHALLSDDPLCCIHGKFHREPCPDCEREE